MPRTIAITGANRGIGLELARQSAARGDRVIALCRDPSAMPADAGAERVLAADVTDAASLAAAAAASGGPVDVLVCNAGEYRGRGRLMDPGSDPEDWRSILMTNVAGPFLTVRAFRQAIAGRPGGRIAIIASSMGSSARAPGGAYAYRASKAAAVNLARNLAAELAADGISVGAYHPGWVRTDMGGPAADIDAAESAAGLLVRFDALGPATTGVFEDWRGAPIPF